MLTLRPLSVLSASIALCTVATVASAQLRPIRPGLLPISSASASSATSAPTSSESSSSVKPIKPLKQGLTVSQQSHLKNYCKDITKLLKRAQSITPNADQASKFNLTVDMLTKADALCKAMLAE